MLISGWNSDVCSSDRTDRHGGAIHRSNGMAERASAPLAHPIACRFFCEGSIVNVRHFQIPPARDQRDRRPVDPPHGCARPGRRAWKVAPRRDRKSVVEGKRGSVRVDSGGGRSIKKKKIKEDI